MPLLNQLLQAGRFSGGIDDLIALRNEELEERTAWEYYLHRIFDQSFEEFREQAKPPQELQNLQQYDSRYVETTIEKSKGILQKFKGKGVS